MKPAFRLLVNDLDYTAALKDRMLEIRHTDKAGIESDNFYITLDDREPQIRVPVHGERLELRLGYEATNCSRENILSKGRYVHDFTEITGSPDKIIFSAMAFNVRGDFAKERTRSFSGISIASIVEQIAAMQKYEFLVDPYYDDVVLKWTLQDNESDARFLARIAKENGAFFKAMGQRLVFVQKGKSKPEDIKKDFGSFTINKDSDVLDYRFTIDDETPYHAVKATWRNIEANRDEKVIIGIDGKTKNLTKVYGTESEARSAANAEWKRLQRIAITGSMTLVGRPDLQAEGELVVKGFRDEVDKTYLLTSVVNTLSDGYKTAIEFELSV